VGKNKNKMNRKLIRNILISFIIANLILLLLEIDRSNSLLMSYIVIFFVSPIGVIFDHISIISMIFFYFYYILLGTIITFIRSKKMMISFLLLIILIHIALEIYLIHKFSHFLS